MKNKTIKNNIIWAVGSSTVMLTGFLLCRFLFFHLHQMDEWPRTLFLLGLAIIVAAAICSARRVMPFVPIGYIGGFALGMVFGTDGVDPGGGATNNTWIIWTVCFLTAILVGLMWEIINKHKRRKNP